MVLHESTHLAAAVAAVAPLRCVTINHGDVLACHVSPPCLGKSDFDAVNAYWDDEFSHTALRWVYNILRWLGQNSPLDAGTPLRQPPSPHPDPGARVSGRTTEAHWAAPETDPRADLPSHFHCSMPLSVNGNTLATTVVCLASLPSHSRGVRLPAYRTF